MKDYQNRPVSQDLNQRETKRELKKLSTLLSNPILNDKLQDKIKEIERCYLSRIAAATDPIRKKELEDTLAKHIVLAQNHYCPIQIEQDALPTKKEPNRKAVLHSRNRYSYKGSRKEFFYTLINLPKVVFSVFKYIYTSKFDVFYESRETIAKKLDCHIDTVTDAFNLLVDLRLITRSFRYYETNIIMINERLLHATYAKAFRKAIHEVEVSCSKFMYHNKQLFKKVRRYVKSRGVYLKKTTKEILNASTQNYHSLIDSFKGALKKIHEQNKRQKELDKVRSFGVEESWIKTLVKKFSLEAIIHNLKKAEQYSQEKEVVCRGGLIYKLCCKDH